MPLAALFAGAALGFGQASLLHSHATTFENVKCDAVITLSEDADLSGYAPRGMGVVLLETGEAIRAQVEIEGDGDFLCGMRYRASVALSKPSASSNDYVWRKGAALRAKVSGTEELAHSDLHGVLLGVRARVLGFLASQEYDTAVVQALACGYRGRLAGTREYADYQACGLAHMVAVSGAHLVIVTGLFSSFLKAVRMPRRISVSLLVCVMGSYIVLSGMAPSCIRAALMSSVGLLSLFGKRRPSSQNALGIALVLMVGVSPYEAVSVSLALSALSTTGIVVFAPLAAQLLERYTPLRPGFACDALSLTTSSALPCQLYACSLFSLLPLVSPLANVITAPLFPFVCALSLMAGLFGACALPGAGYVCLAARAASEVLGAIVHLLASMPLSCVPVSVDTLFGLGVSAFSCAAVWVLWEQLADVRVALGFACVACAFGFALGFAFPFEGIAMLDVGQGDAFLLMSQGKSLLIDTGNRDTQLLAQLAKCGIVHIDSVLVTHSDDDHCGSLDALEQAVDVGSVIVANDMLACDDPSCTALVEQAKRTAHEVRSVSEGDVIRIGKFAAKVLWPKRFADAGGNADSIVLLVTYDENQDEEPEVTSLFTGDAEHEVLETLLKSESLGHVDVLKVGHHGSRNAMTADQLKELSPRVALIGVGANNRYGHPTTEIMEMLDDAGCTTFRTDTDSGIKLSIRGSVLLAQSL